MTHLGLTIGAALRGGAVSDVTAYPAHWHVMLTGQMAHACLGGFLALHRAPLGIVKAIAVAWLAKEAFGGIPNVAPTWPVGADGAADIACGALVSFPEKSQLEKSR